MSVMLYPCMLCVALLMCLFVLCVACLTVFVNCLVKQFAVCVGVVAILLLNVMDVFSVCGGALLDRPCIVVLIGFIQSVMVFKTQRSTVKLGTVHHTALAVPHPLHQYRNRFHHRLQLKLPIGIPSPFFQFSANGIGNKQVELCELLERHKVKVAVIQESKLTLDSRMPNIPRTSPQ